MKNQISFLAIMLPLLLVAAAAAKILHVPATHSSIQAAISAAAPGDTVLVAPGTYFENIKFRGKRIENNTLIGNSSFSDPNAPPPAGQGGAMVIWNGALVAGRNNVFWANIQTQGGPIASLGGTLNLSFSNVEGGYAGTGNIAVYPAFAEARLASNTATITRLTALPIVVSPAAGDTLKLRRAPAQNGLLADTLLLFTNDPTKINPTGIVLRGNANPTPRLEVNTALLNLGNIDINTPRVDTTFFVHNRGTGPDSVYLSIIYRSVRPNTAVSISPLAASIAAGDSLRVTFSIFPSMFTPPLSTFYSPGLVIDARFSPGTTRFEKNTRFRIVGTLAVDEREGNLPATFRLEQNYPNPFLRNGAASTRLRFYLPSAQHVQLRLYDALGRETATLLNAPMTAGKHEVAFASEQLASGVYYFVLQAADPASGGAGKFEARQKMIVLR